MAMCSILFDWVKIILVNNKTQKITLGMRVKAVCFHYITVATTFINHARKKYSSFFFTRISNLKNLNFRLIGMPLNSHWGKGGIVPCFNKYLMKPVLFATKYHF